jgi:hypothetical protein
VESRHDFCAEVDEGSKGRDKSDYGNGFSHVGNVDAYSSIGGLEQMDIRRGGSVAGRLL